MTPQRPIEVVNASKAVSECWDRYDAFVESGDTIGAKAEWVAMEILEDMYRSQYRQWQILGGTSDIESIALAGVVKSTNDPRTPDQIEDDYFACEVKATRESDYPR